MAQRNTEAAQTQTVSTMQLTERAKHLLNLDIHPVHIQQNVIRYRQKSIETKTNITQYCVATCSDQFA